MTLGQFISWVIQVMKEFDIYDIVVAAFGFVVIVSMVSYVVKVLRG